MPLLMELTAEQRMFYWPNLTKNSFKKTSDFSVKYNCVCWALGNKDKFIDAMGYYWPLELPRDHTVNGYKRLYENEGYTICTNGALENGLEKIAIYGDEYDYFKHVALQLLDGSWTSKMGDLEDINHKNLECLEGKDYGTVKIFLCRKRK